jgi:hypothetical protein
MSTDLGVIGNGGFGSLIDRRGRVVWCSLEGFSADPIFNSLLNNDSDESGWFDVTIEDLQKTEQKYIPGTAILVTTLVSKNGDVLQVKDFAPRFTLYDRMFYPYQLFRTVNRVRGDPIATIRVRPSFDYNAAEGYQTRGAHHIRYCGPSGTLRLTTNAPIQLLMDESPFMVHDPIYLVFGQDESITTPLCQLYWKNWGVQICLPVDYQEILIRTSITLQLMQSDEVGGILNSMTLGIPLGPDLPPTRDERAYQLLDTALSVPILRNFGLLTIAKKFLEYLKTTCFQFENLQAVRPISPPKELNSMAGYMGIGALIAGGIPENQSLDIGVLGLMIIALSQGYFDSRFRDICSTKLFDRLEKFGEICIERFSDMCTGSFVIHRQNHLMSHEFFEDDLRYFLSSRTTVATNNRDTGSVPTILSVLCWAAADRLSRVAESCHWIDKSRYWGLHARSMRSEIFARATIVRGQYTGIASYWGGDRIGPSMLRLGELGFINSKDSIFVGTVNLFEIDSPIGLSDRSLSSLSSPFLTSTLLWYAEALRSCGRDTEAKNLFHAICAGTNECGLFSESIDLRSGRHWGNFPHTPSLLGFMRLGLRLSRDWNSV